MKRIDLRKNERIVAVVPESCTGSGWSNRVVWVYIRGDMKKKQGLLYLLERSAELLERSAEEIWISHTIAGRWPKDDKHGARRDFNELCAMAKGLRKAHKYHKPNPLGGPAKMFDAIADRMRAGDSVKECMADYGLKFKRSNTGINRSREAASG